MRKSQSLRADFARAVTRLDEALALPKDPIVRDSAIQRFEISFELCWKFLKAHLEEQHNASCTSPRTCFRSAFRHWVIDNDPFWIDLRCCAITPCNTYNEQLTDNVTVDRVRVAGKFELLSIGGGPKLTSRSRSAAQSID